MSLFGACLGPAITPNIVPMLAATIIMTGIGRWGPGGGDATFDNLTISTPIPEPTTALLLTLGLAGLGMRRRVR